MVWFGEYTDIASVVLLFVLPSLPICICTRKTICFSTPPTRSLTYPMVMSAFYTVGARCKSVAFRGILRIKWPVVVLNEPNIVDHATVVRFWKETRVCLDLLPVDVSAVVHHHSAEAARAAKKGSKQASQHK